ncbi:unnamed protein product, partial [Pleuronectes platessa]
PQLFWLRKQRIMGNIQHFSCVSVQWDDTVRAELIDRRWGRYSVVINVLFISAEATDLRPQCDTTTPSSTDTQQFNTK